MPLGLVMGSGTATVELENPEPGRVEIDPDSLWEKVTKVCTPYLLDSNQTLKVIPSFLYVLICLPRGFPFDQRPIQCCGSGLFIPDPNFYPFWIPDPKTATKKRGEKKFVVKPFFVATNFTKLKIILFFKC
jgi:hypothetical protein